MELRSCCPETAAAVPGPAGRQSSARQSLTSLATGNSEGGSVPCQEQIPSTQLKADPYSADDCRPPSRQQHPGMLQIPGSVTCVVTLCRVSSAGRIIRPDPECGCRLRRAGGTVSCGNVEWQACACTWGRKPAGGSKDDMLKNRGRHISEASMLGEETPL